MKIALAKTKQITNLVKERWNAKDSEYTLLDLRAPPPEGTRLDTAAYLAHLNEQVEANRASHPSHEDLTEQQISENEEMQDEKIVELVQQHNTAKLERQASNQAEKKIETNIKKAKKHQQEIDIARERANQRRQKLQDIDDDREVSMMSAIKQRRNKK